MIDLSLLDVFQIGAALLAVICLLVTFLPVRKPASQDSTLRFHRIISILSWFFIVFLAVDLGLLGGRWLADSQKPIKILSPVEGQVVDLRIYVTGRARTIPENLQLWVVVTPQESVQYYPASARAVIQTSGEWSSLAFIGSEDDHGKTYNLLVVLADASAAAKLSENNQSGLLALPSGCLIVDQIMINRK